MRSFEGCLWCIHSFAVEVQSSVLRRRPELGYFCSTCQIYLMDTGRNGEGAVNLRISYAAEDRFVYDFNNKKTNPTRPSIFSYEDRFPALLRRDSLPGNNSRFNQQVYHLPAMIITRERQPRMSAVTALMGIEDASCDGGNTDAVITPPVYSTRHR